MTKYIIDANILIQAYRKYYTMDVFISFWSHVQRLAESDVVVSIDKVGNEIIPGGDDLASWCIAQLPTRFFMNSAVCLGAYANIISQVTALNKYTPNALAEFSQVGESDAFLVAMALTPSPDDYVLVTEEHSEPNRINKVKIPDVCSMVGVRHINTIEMLKELNITI